MDSENRKPFIQIDNEVREMTDEEYAQYVVMQSQSVSLHELLGITDAD